MKYDHVGRPTNEEVSSRKRKKMLKIVLPIIALFVIVGVIVGGKLSGLMGNSFDVSKCQPCDKTEGWFEGDNNTCYRNREENNQVDAILVGDVDKDGEITLKDYAVIQRSIEAGEQFTDEQKLVYDLNQDGFVNEYDISGYSTDTNGQFLYNKKYTCPLTKTDDSEENGIKIIKTYEYKYNDATLKCDVKIAIKETKNAVCDLKEVNEPSVEEELDFSEIVEEETCDNNVCHDSVLEVPEKNSVDALSKNEVGIIQRKSNSLDYGSGNGTYGIVHIYSVNKKSAAKEGNFLIYSSAINYGTYSDSKCNKKITDYTFKLSAETSSISAGSDWAGLSLNTRHYALRFPKKYNKKIYYVKQLNSPKGYESNSECKKLVFKDGNKVIFKNNPLSSNHYAYVTIDGKKVSNQNDVRIYESDKSIINNNVSKKNYTFVGYQIQRSQDNKYLCYKSRNSSSKEWKTSCSYHVLVQSGGSVNGYIGDLNNGSTLKLKSYWLKNR